MGGCEGLPEQQTPVSDAAWRGPFLARRSIISPVKRARQILFLFYLLLVNGGRLPCTSNAGHLDYITQSCTGRGCLAAAHRQTLGRTRLTPPLLTPLLPFVGQCFKQVYRIFSFEFISILSAHTRFKV